jgi:hypothetical protein
MNIFAYDPCYVQSATWLDDVRSNKMIVESSQLMSTAMHVLTPGHGKRVYKLSFLNHPCAIWARASQANFTWLLNYTETLYEQRKRAHKTSRLFPIFRTFANDRSNFPLTRQTPFVNCARSKDVGVDYTHIRNVHAAYRLYHRERWSMDTINLSWHHGQEPTWRHA